MFHIEKIIHAIEHLDEIKYYDIRDLLYNLLIFDIDISDFLFYTLNYFISKKRLTSDNVEKLLYDVNHFFSQYNNNYRPIFHLETIFYKLCIAVKQNNGITHRLRNSV